MSADFWGWCPCCIADVRQDDSAFALDQAMMTLGRTVAEYHEIGLDGNPVGDPNIRNIYKAKCEKCGAAASFDTTVTMRRP